VQSTTRLQHRFPQHTSSKRMPETLFKGMLWRAARLEW
jgi:hypothetical protein